MYRELFYEGQQADEYRARRAKEKEEAEKAEEERTNRRYSDNPGFKKIYKDANHQDQYKGKGNRSEYQYRSKDDIDRGKKTHEIISKEHEKRFNDYINHLDTPEHEKYKDRYEKTLTGADSDAVIRHLRRHPRTESGIFESVYII